MRPFTVEVRQTKRRTKPTGAGAGWIDAKVVLSDFDEESQRIARSAFKTPAVEQLAEAAAPSPSGRILPSLVEAPVQTASPIDAGPGKLQRRQGAGKRANGKPRSNGLDAPRPADYRRSTSDGEAPGPLLAAARPASETPEPRLNLSTASSEKPASPAGARNARAPKPKTPTRRPAKRNASLEDVRPAAAARSAVPDQVPSASPSPVEPSSGDRKGRILSRYVYRDVRPGESWKQRLRARKERRV